MQITQISPKFNITTNKINEDFKRKEHVSFTATPVPMKSKFFKPLNNAYNKFTNYIAEGIGKILDTDIAEKIVNKTKDSKHLNKYYISHLMAVGSLILSSLYVKKTLNNHKLDEQKRKTLAINQTSVWGISTIMGYTFSLMANNKISKFIKKFEEINKGHEKLKNYKNGIKVAATVMIFDIVYRYIAPVIVTPIANHIGNKIQEKKEAEIARKAL